MYRFYNPNPTGKRVGDCTVRALSKAIDVDWDSAFLALFIQAYSMKDMPSSNSVWGELLRQSGFERKIVPNECPDCYTLRDFCEEYPEGVYVVAMPSHVCTVINGDYFDAWDSGDETPLYFWERKEK